MQNQLIKYAQKDPKISEIVSVMKEIDKNAMEDLKNISSNLTNAICSEDGSINDIISEVVLALSKISDSDIKKLYDAEKELVKIMSRKHF